MMSEAILVEEMTRSPRTAAEREILPSPETREFAWHPQGWLSAAPRRAGSIPQDCRQTGTHLDQGELQDGAGIYWRVDSTSAGIGVLSR